MTDAQMVSAVLDGDTGQFGVLVERYAGMVRGLCAAHVGGHSAQEDLAQEAFIDGYVKLGHLRKKDRFGPWLARITRNKCKSWLRREVTRRRVYDSALTQVETPPPEVLAALDRAEMRAFVRQAIAGLPGKTREAMMLCYVEGATIKEAALFLKASEAAVKKRLEYGRRLVSDGLWKVMTEHTARPEQQRVLKKRVLAAIPLTTLPARAGFGAWVAAKIASLGAPAAVIPAVLLLAGAATWYCVHESTPSDAAPPPAQLMAETAQDGSGVAQLPAMGAPDEAVLATGTLNVSLRYRPFQPQGSPRGPGNGREAPYARVLIAPVGDDDSLLGPRKDWVEEETDAAGRFRAVLKPGSYVVVGRAVSDATPWSEADMRLEHRAVGIQVGKASETTLWLSDPERSIRGRIIDAATGEPITGVQAKITVPMLRPASRSHFVDENGAFAFPHELLPAKGTFTLEAVAETHLPMTPLHGNLNLWEPLPAYEITLTARGAVSGHVHQANGQPASGISIMSRDADESGATGVATTDAGGFYSFPHDGGALRLYASAASTSSEDVTVELEPEASAEQDFVLPLAARVILDIRTPEGEVPERIRTVSLSWARHSHSGGLVRREGDLFVLPYLQPAQYNLSLLVEGFSMTRLDFEIGIDCANKRFDITLRKGEESLRVRVVDEKGAPVPDATIGVMVVVYSYDEQGRQRGSSATGLMSANANEQGEHVFKGLAPGDYRIYSGKASQDVVLPSPRTLVLKTVPRKRDSLHLVRTDVHVFDATRDDRPLLTGEASVYTLCPSGRLSSDGAPDLEVGENQVFFIKRGYTVGMKTLHVSQEFWDARMAKNSSTFGEVEIRIGEGGSLYGVAEEVDGTPWVNQDLQVYPEDVWAKAQESGGHHLWTSFGRALAQGARSNETGAFELRHLPPGHYMVAIGKDAAAGPFEVLAGHETGPAVLQKKD